MNAPGNAGPGDAGPVVIVGAGPCGLAMAGELLRMGIGVRVLDDAGAKVSTVDNRAPDIGSRATMLWPSAQAVLGDLGVLPEIRTLAILPKALEYRADKAVLLARIALKPDEAPLLIPQSTTQAVLESAVQRLGGSIERGVRLTGISQTADRVDLVAVNASGDELRLSTPWLIGADGVHSTVRKELGITFNGSELAPRAIFAEGTLTGSKPGESVVLSYYVTSRGLLLIAPLPNGRIKISGPIGPDREVTAQLVQDLVDERGPGGLRVTDLTALTTFASAERIANRMRQGRCFLVGDAAHTHSALGGQGLNIGLQDARNLAWKLAGVLTGRLDPAILDTYEPERRAAAEYVIRFTGTTSRLALLKPPWNRLRTPVIRAALGPAFLRHRYVSILAGRRIRYPTLDLGCRSSTGPAGLPAPHWAAPAQDEPTRYTLVTTGKPDVWSAPAATLVRRHAPILGHRHVDRARAGFLLVRPDGYVALTGRATSLDEVDQLLTNITNITN
jgi:2-polyprenyl-6-methoxyphenol hydroxylase-like FAD-dependent oxidoreductase